ncbi:GNAT family N-acetyltransferase [Cohnella candidum]|uniref:GNAT family N-acetyltransferase n=1 Tax=Cohnella candidum TaxID=2674991 RepID=A0A3G3K030_9BACL|nr:GNAT family N-acetyltransferase [Cohnella candidum]AYQ73773.1 GNAT family N-acetyltransferase [Cohnella candidum]
MAFETAVQFIRSTLDLAAEELEIHNTNRFFNRISKDKEQFTREEIEEEIRNAADFGAERFLIRDGDLSVGVIEYLMKNPNDGQTWLGLLVIRQDLHSRGYAKAALRKFYGVMREGGVTQFRIGVLENNDPAHAFWTRQGFRRLDGMKQVDGRNAVVYEKSVPEAH